MKAVLEIRNFRKKFGTVVALDAVSLALYPGEICAIVGPNGAGKSTLLKGISCLEQVDSGDALLEAEQYLRDGEIVTPSVANLRSQIVTVLQNPHLFPTMTIADNLTFALRHVHRKGNAEAEAAAREIASKLGIIETLDRYPHQISGGQAQVVSVARAVLMKPKVLLLDEITSALSPTAIVAVIDALRVLGNQEASSHLSILLVTHLMRFATEFAQTIRFMNQGRIIESGNAATFIRDCSSFEAKSFFSANKNPF